MIKTTVLCFAICMVNYANIEAFAPLTSNKTQCAKTKLNMKKQMDKTHNPKVSQMVSNVIYLGVIGSSILFPQGAFADEIGRETEAPTLFTGETVEVRRKRQCTTSTVG